MESDSGNAPIKLRKQVKAYLLKQPNFTEVLRTAGQNADSLIEDLLRKPQVRERLRELYIERLDPSKRLENEILVEQLEKEIEAIKRELIDLDEINNEIAKLQAEIRQAKRDIEIKPNYAEYEKINQQIQKLQKGLEQYEEQRKGNPNIRLDLFVDPGFSSVEDVLNKISELRRELADDKFNDIRTLQETIEENQIRIQRLEDKKSRHKPEEQANLRRQLAQKKAELRKAHAELMGERMRYAEDIRKMPEEAVKAYLDETLNAAAEHYIQKAQEAAKKEEERKQKLLNSAVEKLGRRLGRKEEEVNGQPVYLPDKSEALPFLAALGRPDGLDEFINQFARNARTLQTQYGLSREEAQTFYNELQSNPEYRRNVAQELAKKVLADYLRAGGKLTKDLVLSIVNSEWGESILQEGRNLSKQQKQLIENIADKGILEKVAGASKELLGKNWKRVLVIILLILLGVGGVALAQSKGLF